MKNQSKQQIQRWITSIGIVMLSVLMISAPALSQYSNPATVDLLTAGNFRVLAGTAVTIGSGNTITGDVGVSPGSTVTNSGAVTGSIHQNDAAAVQAQSDLMTAYTDAAGRVVNETVGSELGGSVLGRGVYTSAAGTFGITGNLTLNGSATDIFIFKMATTLTTSAGSSVTLTGGALAANVFWQVGSSATIDGDFKGIILAFTAITQNVSAQIDGRTLAANSFATLNGNNVLPVELVSFTANSKGQSAELNWKTATEVNNAGFEVQRSEVSGQLSETNVWVNIGFVEGSGASNAPREYSFTDQGLPTGRYSYRLKQIDRDGGIEYLRTVEVNVGELPADFILLQNYPNPFNPSTVIEYQVPVSVHVKLAVYDMIGNEVSVLVNKAQEQGRYSVQFNGASLSSGIYFYTLNAGTFTSVKKFTLLK